LPDAAELELEALKFDGQAILLLVRASRPESACPRCYRLSTHIHSHYQRKLADN